MTGIQLIKEEIVNARETFEGTVADILEEHIHKDPGGKALTLAGAYAHLIFSEDMTINRLLQEKPPLYDNEWKDKTGVSAPLPQMGPNWNEEHAMWAKTVKVNLNKLRKYSKAVYAETDKYVGKLKNEDLDKKVNMGEWGEKTIAYLLYAYVIGHTNSLSGEISAIKGVFGVKGYSF